MIKIYNTFTQEKENFEPLDPQDVKMYVCGPTVYDLLHIGNFRGPIFFNLVRNWLEHSGMKVRYAYNYTDIDDKIIKRAQDEGSTLKAVSERYIEEFEKDFARLGLRAHDYNPRVTEHLKDIESTIETLLERGHAYTVAAKETVDSEAREVLYRVSSFAAYGKLSKKKLGDLEEGRRVEVDGRKENPQDFVLWKPAKASEPWFASPWGKGRPGWHIECTAMIRSIFKGTIDIHGGGIDLIFPHHENEIAQGEGCSQGQYCRYWMHNNFINLNDEKMSKSLGNVVTARSFMEEYHPEILKMLFLAVHYRSQLAVNEKKISQVMASLYKLYSSLLEADLFVQGSQVSESQVSESLQISFEFSYLKEADEKIRTGLNDDFNSSELVAALFYVNREFNHQFTKIKNKKTPENFKWVRSFAAWTRERGALAALLQESPQNMLKALEEIYFRKNNIDPAAVSHLLEERKTARENKNWPLADELRQKLLALGIEAMDGHPTRSFQIRFRDAWDEV